MAGHVERSLTAGPWHRTGHPVGTCGAASEAGSGVVLAQESYPAERTASAAVAVPWMAWMSPMASEAEVTQQQQSCPETQAAEFGSEQGCVVMVWWCLWAQTSREFAQLEPAMQRQQSA